MRSKRRSAVWGIILITVGLLIIVRMVFNIYLPIFRIALGIGLIYLGLEVLSDSFSRRSKRYDDEPESVVHKKEY